MAEEIECFCEEIARFGETDLDYLRFHFRRFSVTRDLFLQGWDQVGGRVLDVGAHWLHQAVLWSQAGFEVTALDLPLTLERESVRALADAHGIQLLIERDLEHATGLAEVADDTFDVVMFCEIIEHLTFNPVAMWKEIYRVLAPGGKIVITTPNYYALRALVIKAGRFALLRGGGLPHHAILRMNTYCHHWKEYSAIELRRYFRMLSDDFALTRMTHVRDYYPARSRWASVFRPIEAVIPLLRPNLHVELTLQDKQHGIQFEPGW